MKLMLVDDDKLIRDAIKTYFCWENEGFTIVNEASNGNSALKWLKNNPVDIILTDISMPHGNGIELIRELKKQGFRGEIIVMSNYDDYDYVRDALKLGAFDYCLKYKLSAEYLLELLRNAERSVCRKRADLKGISHRQEIESIFLAVLKEQLTREQIRQYIACGMLKPFYLLIYVDLENSACIAAELFAGAGFADVYVVQVSINEVIIVVPENYCEAKEWEGVLKGIAVLILEQHADSIVVYSPERTSPECFQKRYAQMKLNASDFFYCERRVIRNNQGHEYVRNISWEIECQMEQSLHNCAERLDSAGFEKTWNEILLYFGNRRVDPKEVCRFFDKTTYGICQKFGCETIQTRFSMEHVDCISQLKEALLYWGENFFLIPVRSGRPEIIHAIHYIHANYMRNINLEDVADSIYMSKNHFCTLFRREMGENFVVYLQRLRIEKAKIYLRDHKYHIQEVAEKVGIDNYRYFSTLFQKYTGMTPSQYRKKL